MAMKDLKLLVWLTQLGLSTSLPLAGFVFLALWLRNTFSLGSWVLWVGIIIGVIAAVDGLLQSLRILDRLSNKKEDSPPPVSYNDHD